MVLCTGANSPVIADLADLKAAAEARGTQHDECTELIEFLMEKHRTAADKCYASPPTAPVSAPPPSRAQDPRSLTATHLQIACYLFFSRCRPRVRRRLITRCVPELYSRALQGERA